MLWEGPVPRDKAGPLTCKAAVRACLPGGVGRLLPLLGTLVSPGGKSNKTTNSAAARLSRRGHVAAQISAGE